MQERTFTARPTKTPLSKSAKCVGSKLGSLTTSQASREILEENQNQRVVRALYEALNARDAETVAKLLAPDLEWWFHGPPTHQFLMRLLTGASSDDSFSFDPQSFTSFGSTVLVEGCDQSRSISWIHAWTITDGVITQVREYLNTSLTVTRLGNTTQLRTATAPNHCPSVWESSLSNRVGKSVPGLVLAI
ncbi:Wound-induced protein Wun1-like [Dillenia turbinata]|uniref:Wound-induced protein Wun1-like n=1 Tax=Dillenia turbinata TaxID=194707 RepID=A0AAN8VNU1_9MAGN